MLSNKYCVRDDKIWRNLQRAKRNKKMRRIKYWKNQRIKNARRSIKLNGFAIVGF